MIRTLFALAAFAALPAFASAQEVYTDAGSLTVHGQPPNAYVITIDTIGKDEPAMRQEIWDAAYTACQRAPRTGNVLDIRVSGAAWDANAQFDQILQTRREAAYSYYGR